MNEKSDQHDWTHLLGIVDFEGGSLSNVSKELLGKGRELADQLGVWLMAYSISPLSGRENEVISHGADLVLMIPPPPGRVPSPLDLMTQSALISNLIHQERPEVVLFTSSLFSISTAARVAQHFKTGLATDCTSLSLDLAERRLLATSPLYEGKLFQEVYWPARRPQIAVLKPGAFPEAFPDPYREGTIK